MQARRGGPVKRHLEDPALPGEVLCQLQTGGGCQSARRQFARRQFARRQSARRQFARRQSARRQFARRQFARRQFARRQFARWLPVRCLPVRCRTVHLLLSGPEPDTGHARFAAGHRYLADRRFECCPGTSVHQPILAQPATAEPWAGEQLSPPGAGFRLQTSPFSMSRSSALAIGKAVS